ncbi:MAG: hypothetical protein H0Z39_03860 [Peptococcaceae bacterium]|nr:hypothetical protein [Peptococcaceae bacterium]
MSISDLTNRERQLIAFLRQLGWGEVKIRVENGQPVVIYEAIKTRKLEEDEVPERVAGSRRHKPRLSG